MEQTPASKCDVKEALKPLRVLAKCLAILPVTKARNHCWARIVILFYICSYVFTTHGKFTNMREVLASSIFVMDVATDFTLGCSLISTIILINVMRADKEEQLLKKLADLDNEFSKLGKNIISHKKKFYIELIFTHLVFIAYYAYYCWMWIGSLGFAIFKFCFMRDFQPYHLLILSLILRNYALSIKYRVECLNEILSDLNILCGSTICIVGRGKSYISKFTSVEKIKKLYIKLCTIIRDYNELFGECFVILYINIVFNLLGPAYLAFVYGSGENDIAGVRYGLTLKILCIVWCSLPMINSWAIFSGCDQCAQELAKTPYVCYVVLQNLSNDGQEGSLKSELRELAQEASNLKPEICATGFFIVNYTVMFSLVGSITAYLIVLIQFNK